MAFDHLRTAIQAAPSWTLTPSARLVLFTLSYLTNSKNHRVWATQETLCSITGLSRATLNRALATLSKDGFVTRKARAGTSTIYTLNLNPVSHHETGVSHHETHPSVGCLTMGHYQGIQQEHLINDLKDVPTKKPVDTPPTKGEIDVKHPKGLSVLTIAKKSASEYADLTDEQILTIPMVEGVPTPHGLAVCWKKARGRYAGCIGVAPSVMKKDEALLAKANQRVDGILPLLILAVMKDWPGFVAYATKTAGAFKLPTEPRIPAFVAQVEAAIGFAASQEEAASNVLEFVQPAKKKANVQHSPVQSIAKPATITLADLDEACSEA